MRDYFRIALRAVLDHKLRSGLTLLGVVIGVWAITSMQSVVNGFDNAMEEELSALGTETFVVQKFPAVMVGHGWWEYARRKDLTYEDALYLKETAIRVRAVTAVVAQGGETIKYKDRKTAPSVQVIGTMADYLATEAREVTDGRFFSEYEVENPTYVVVLGQDVVTELFPYEDPVGKRVLVGSQGFMVIGVMEPRTSSFGMSADNVVIMPITTYKRAYGSSRSHFSSTSLTVRAWDAQQVDEAMDEVIALLRVKRKVPLSEENDFEIITAESIMSTLEDLTGYIRMAAIGIAGISLLVAGIGIMNIMLVSVMERTREIGTRKAVGARRRDILFQFLIEAIILSEFGAIMGILLGALTAMALSPVLEMPARIPAWAVMAAIGYCSAIGIFFGLYPANKASKLDPIEALRYE